MKKNILAALVTTLVLAGAAFILLQPKSEVDITETPPDIAVNASELYQAFSMDEAAANRRYVGKILEVQGTLRMLSKTKTGTQQLTLHSGDDFGNIVCTLQEKDKQLSARLAPGVRITVKGICTGYLFDVVIDQAVILQKS